jgi:hypothetical protein
MIKSRLSFLISSKNKSKVWMGKSHLDMLPQYPAGFCVYTCSDFLVVLAGLQQTGSEQLA